eukprot:EG_transcript_12492
MPEQIYDNILDFVGNTPCVRVPKLAKSLGLQCELIVKCEFFNPGGSVKDRIAKAMVLDAEKAGILKPGDTIVEPTSGNTGIGLALVAAVKGYKCLLTMPQKMSQEKVATILALGSQVIRTPTEAAWDSPESHIGVANRVVAANPLTHHCLDQYSNASNPKAHVEGTAEEIFRQTGGRLDMIVIAAGTGGTLTGTARRLKELIPNLKVIGVDPDGSILHDDNAPIHSYKVEGIGYDFIPKVLDRSLVDKWVVTDDAGSFKLARQMIREEGLLCGGSSGAAMAAAAQTAASLGPNQRCLVLLPDGIRNYMTKFLDDKWMAENGFEASPAAPKPRSSGGCPFDPVLQLWARPAVRMGLLTGAAFALGFALGHRK